MAGDDRGGQAGAARSSGSVWRKKRQPLSNFPRRGTPRSRCCLMADPITIARDLLRCRSVTPDDGGALAYLQRVLEMSGFTVHCMTFAEPGTAPIENLYARVGMEQPNLVFAGHTDVVP